MYARITNYQVKPDRIDEMMSRVESVRGEVQKVAGLTDSYSVWRADGKGLVVGIWESEAAAEAGAAEIQKIWAGLADFLAGPPSVEAYENVDHMTA